jgi:AcrR family transcriptional regulator
MTSNAHPPSGPPGEATPTRAAASRRGKPADRAAGDMRERILDAAVELLRRHGPAKTSVVDVARSLDMSHANVYRHFASKAALQDAVAERWLKAVSDPLQAIAEARDGGPSDAAERLERWVLALAEVKRRKVLSDPELFATYHALAQEARQVADAHVAELHAQVAAIIRDGMAQGVFKVTDPDAAARAVLNATLRFHHPHHVREAGGRENEAEIKAVMRLLLTGLRAGSV